MTHVPQLLTVWNPYFEPQTIAEHVAILKEKRRHVWWGRIKERSRLSVEQARSRWAKVAALADEQERTGRELALYVTNFVSLHVLRVAGIRFGDRLPADEEELAPRYYAAGVHVPLWFRVTDIRALAYDQLQTIHYLTRELGPVAPDDGTLGGGATFRYDPFADCKRTYPVVVPGPPVEALFDERLRKTRGGRPVALFADLRDTLHPPEVEEARGQLQARLGDVWDALEEKSRQYLASAMVIHGRHARTSDFDHATIVTGLARAVEVELWEGLYPRVLASLDAPHPAFASFAAQDGRTLGAARHLLAAVAELAEARRWSRLEALCGDRGWLTWLNGFVEVRNDSSHGRLIPPRRFQRHWEALVPESGASRLAPLVRAKEDLGPIPSLAPRPAVRRRTSTVG